jgi:hypothetical protein
MKSDSLKLRLEEIDSRTRRGPHSLRQLPSSDQRVRASLRISHVEDSVFDSKPLLKEVSDVICCYQSRAGGYSQSGEAVGCQLA